MIIVYASFSDLLEWSELLKQSADPVNVESLRENTAQALGFAGCSVIQHCMGDVRARKIITK